MDTRAKRTQVSHFIIIVPHRDSLKPVEEYRTQLFTAGVCGALSFPVCAPLACVSRPFSRLELKELAANILSRAAKTGGKLQTSTAAFARCPLAGYFFGPRLDLAIPEAAIPETAREKVLCAYAPPVLCAALVDSSEDRAFGQAPVVSFRAAFLTNLSVRPLPGADTQYSFEWRMGGPVWFARGGGFTACYPAPCTSCQSPAPQARR